SIFLCCLILLLIIVFTFDGFLILEIFSVGFQEEIRFVTVSMAAICHYINYGSFLRQHSQSQVNKDNPTRILPQSPLLVCANGFVCINSGLGRYFNKPCGRSLNGDRDRGPSLMCSASTGSSAAVDGGNGDEIDSGTLIWRAIKLPIYSVALIPLMVSLSTLMYSVIEDAS
ncbi:hypothetical protein Leryth_006864, partial [Lithospermum erythrorhizon]